MRPCQAGKCLTLAEQPHPAQPSPALLEEQSTRARNVRPGQGRQGPSREGAGSLSVARLRPDWITKAGGPAIGSLLGSTSGFWKLCSKQSLPGWSAQDPPGSCPSPSHATVPIHLTGRPHPSAALVSTLSLKHLQHRSPLFGHHPPS